jgi:dolichyl-phosphate beta-glucosyltransferase
VRPVYRSNHWNVGECVRTPPHSDAVRLSVIIPAYNEALRLCPYLTDVTSYLGQRGCAHEVVVVDDGSHDATAALVEGVAATCPAIQLIRLDRNHGKGCAVRTGVLQAHGEFLLIADADGATPIREVERLENALANGADLAIGSRALASRNPDYVVVARSHRTVLGNLFNWIVQRLGLEGIQDTQCGFKLFRQRVARDLFSRASVDGYGFDLEILYVARRRGHRIAEVPINWTDQAGTRVSVLRDGLLMLRDLLAVRRRYAAGGYAADTGHEHDVRDYAEEIPAKTCRP